jgi:uncharacterized protein with NRDE domain
VCTIIALRGVRADYPLVIATNRDEFYARATSGPGRLLEHPRTVGGRDLQAGGTWMGVTEAGVFVGVTNHRSLVQASEPTRRSRGELVLNALSQSSVSDMTRYVQSLDGREYNSFNLMWGDASALWVAYGRSSERALTLAEVPDGVHVLPNDQLDSASFVSVGRAKQLIAPIANADINTLSRGLEEVLRDRLVPSLQDIPEPPPASRLDRALLRELAALCVRTPAYGTRSSTVVLLEPGRVGQFLYADGPPDQTPFVDITHLFADA